MGKEEILTLLNLVIEDLELLKSGQWVPDENSINESIENLNSVEKYLIDN